MSVIFQIPLYCLDRVVVVNSRRSLRAPHHYRDLPVCHSLLYSQDEHLALSRRQSFQRHPHPLSRLLRDKRVQRPVLANRVVLVHLRRVPPPRVSPPPIQDQAPRDREKPGAKGLSPRNESIPPKARTNVSCTTSSTRPLTRACHKPTQRVRMPRDQPRRRSAVARLPAPDQLQVCLLSPRLIGSGSHYTSYSRRKIRPVVNTGARFGDNPLMPSRRRRPLAIAHRGAHSDHPENSLPAILRAIELGAQGIEIDVHATADGVLVVHHDPDLADGGQISAMSAEEIGRRKLSPGVGIARLDEVLDAVAGKAILFIETKVAGVEFPLLRAIRSSNAESAVHSFHHETIRNLKLTMPALRAGILTNGSAAAALRAARRHPVLTICGTTRRTSMTRSFANVIGSGNRSSPGPPTRNPSAADSDSWELTASVPTSFLSSLRSPGNRATLLPRTL